MVLPLFFSYTGHRFTIKVTESTITVTTRTGASYNYQLQQNEALVIILGSFKVTFNTIPFPENIKDAVTYALFGLTETGRYKTAITPQELDKQVKTQKYSQFGQYYHYDVKEFGYLTIATPVFYNVTDGSYMPHPEILHAWTAQPTKAEAVNIIRSALRNMDYPYHITPTNTSRQDWIIRKLRQG